MMVKSTVAGNCTRVIFLVCLVHFITFFPFRSRTNGSYGIYVVHFFSSYEKVKHIIVFYGVSDVLVVIPSQILLQ